jgi:protein-tyrosine phosphatase
MINILFVCLGNICRSPLAEGTFRELVAQKGVSDKITCDSAGTHGYHIGTLPHNARKLSSDDFANFDYIVAMDESNLEHIQVQSYRSTGFYPEEGRIFLYRDFDQQADSQSVPDPYYEDMAAFEEVYQIVNRCGESFLEYLIKEHNLE